jgi:hypothetical protein
MMALLPSGHNLCAHIGRVVLRAYTHRDTLTHSSRPPSNMVTADVQIILLHRIWALCIMHAIHVVPIDIPGAAQGHTYHSQLVADPMDSLDAILHCNKLRSKDT